MHTCCFWLLEKHSLWESIIHVLCHNHIFYEFYKWQKSLAVQLSLDGWRMEYCLWLPITLLYHSQAWGKPVLCFSMGHHSRKWVVQRKTTSIHIIFLLTCEHAVLCSRELLWKLFSLFFKFFVTHFCHFCIIITTKPTKAKEFIYI